MVNVNRMFARMKLYHEMVKDIRLDILRQGSYDPSCPKGVGRGKRVLKPNIGDIIMTCNPDKHNDAKYGIVEGLKSDQTLQVRYRGDKKATEVPTRLWIPLAAACLFKTSDIEGLITLKSFYNPKFCIIMLLWITSHNDVSYIGF